MVEIRFPEMDTLREFLDGWHIVKVEKVGYLHDIAVVARVEFIHDDVKASTYAEVSAQLRQAWKEYRFCQEVTSNDFARIWHNG